MESIIDTLLGLGKSLRKRTEQKQVAPSAAEVTKQLEEELARLIGPNGAIEDHINPLLGMQSKS